MGWSKKIDSGASWEAAFGENGIPTPSKAKNVWEEGGGYPQRKGTFSLGT